MKQLSHELHHRAKVDVLAIREAPHDRIGLPALRWIADLAEVEREPIALAYDIARCRVAALERLLGGAAHEWMCDRHQPAGRFGCVERRRSYCIGAWLLAPGRTQSARPACPRRDARRRGATARLVARTVREAAPAAVQCVERGGNRDD